MFMNFDKPPQKKQLNDAQKQQKNHLNRHMHEAPHYDEHMMNNTLEKVMNSEKPPQKRQLDYAKKQQQLDDAMKHEDHHQSEHQGRNR